MRLLTAVIDDVLAKLDRLRYFQENGVDQSWLMQLHKDLTEIEQTMHEDCFTDEHISEAFDQGYASAEAMHTRDKEKDQ